MEDHQIIELYWGRSERAIEETKKKYGGLLQSIAYGVLGRWDAFCPASREAMAGRHAFQL